MKWNSSPIATLLFLLVAAAILYGCTALVLNIARSSLGRDDERQQEAAVSISSPTPAASLDPEASSFSVASIITPPPSPFPVSAAPDTPLPTVTPTAPQVTPSPEPTLLPLTTAMPMQKGSASVLLIAMDAHSHPDWVVAAHIRDHTCNILSVPRNILTKNKVRLSNAGSAKTCTAMLKYVYPVQYPIVLTVDREGLKAFVDQFGGVDLGGETLDGEAVDAYLENGPSDELLRIERQQAFMQAYLIKLQTVGILTLLSARFSLEQYLDSNLNLTESVTLLEIVRGIDPRAVSFHTLPVDSTMLDGQRCYVPDVRRINEIVNMLTN